MKKAKTAEMGATEFKAHCLALMEEIHSGKRGELIVTKRGKPLVKIVRPVAPKARPIVGSMKGTFSIHGDLMAQTSEMWDAESGRFCS